MKLFKSLDKFTKIFIITAILITIATPFIVDQYQNFNPDAARRPILVGPGQQYPTLASAYPVLKRGVTVQVLPGVYNERLILKNGVKWDLSDGVVIDYAGADNLATVSDDGIGVKATITGAGVLRRSVTARSSVINITNPNTVVSITVKQIEQPNVWPGTGMYVVDGKVKFYGDVISAGMGVRVGNQTAVLEFYGNVQAGNDYGILSSGQTMVRGNVISQGNSAIHCSAGNFDFVGTATSAGLYGAEKSGGNLKITDSTIESKRDVHFEGAAISNYGGELLTLDNVTLLSVNALDYSIETQGQLQTATVLRDSHANRPIDPKLTVTGGQIIVDLP